MTCAGCELAPDVGAVPRRRARGAERRAATVAELTYAFRDLESCLCHLELLTIHVPTSNPSLERSQPADARGRFPSPEGSGVGRFIGSPNNLQDGYWDHEPTANRSQEADWQEADERLLPSWEESEEGRFMGRHHCQKAGHWDHESSLRSLTHSFPPIGWERVPEGRVRVRFIGRRLATADGARPVRQKKRKREVRRRNTRPAAGRLRRSKQSKNVRRRTPAGKLGAVKSGARALRGHETVVVVTEHAPSRGAVARLLKRLGYRVVEAANGIEAQQLAGSQRRIDLLLAEFSGLGTSGVELVRWFSANRPEVKVLVASDWLWEVESCLGDLPQVGVLAKHFTPTELARMVRAILR